MTREALQTFISEQFADASFEEGGQFLNLQLPSEKWEDLAVFLKNTPELNFDFLFCLTCVDWLQHLTMVYHLRSTSWRHELVVKCKLDRNNPIIHTAAMVWHTANFNEREVAELFGVTFLQHPDMRKLLLTDDWEGYPLRKDYEDPINMIKL